MADETYHALCNAHLLCNLEESIELEVEPNGWAALLEPVLEHYESLLPPDRERHCDYNLALWQEREACLRFMADPAVPFTHNRAERAPRCLRYPRPTALHPQPGGASRTPIDTSSPAAPSPTTGRSEPCAWPRCT